jgi:primase-polymerase (primpol)-like protein/uncharacterized coiled-coil protein SlyX
MTYELTIDESVLPPALVEHDQWICWREQERDGKPTKVPISPTNGGFASSTDEQTWTSFDDALEHAEIGKADGIGFVFTADDPFVGIDLDDCRDPETDAVDETAQDIIDRLDSYTERSPSGTGYHVIVQGELPGSRNRKGKVEMYDSVRFFTVTGEHVAETPTTVATRQDALTAIHREYVQDDVTDENSDLSSETADESSAAIDLDDEELLEKARNATNGAKFERLWNGNTRSYESQSEADMALCFLLAFWTGGDATWMDQLFRRSGLMREKWDEVHYADGSTYGEKTVERAIAGTSEFYDPDEVSDGDPEDAGHQPVQERPESQAREQTYLAEKNRLLTERVAELEATLAQKDERIDALEADCRDLRDALADREAQLKRLVDRRDVDEEGSDDRTHHSVWSRAKRFIGNSDE